MDSFRNLNIQRTLGMVILFAALFSHIQLLYACDAMDGEPKHVCCCGEHVSAGCPMADSCAMHENATENQCCEVSYDAVTDEATINSTSTVDCLTLLLDGPQPPPVIEFQQFSPAPLQRLSQLTLAANQPLILSRGKHTYLLTRRLRL